MEAVLFHEHGDIDVLKHEDVPKPEVRDDEVLIEVRATSVNHLDLHIRDGIPTLRLDLPHIPGCDAAGVIEEVGKDVEDWEEGDRVMVDPVFSCGECEYCLRGEQSMCNSFKLLGEHINGAYAEYVSVPVENLIPLPDHVDFVESAASGLVYMTAWRMVTNKADIVPGDEVLVLGASGGVGSAAVQMAKLMGAYVYATAGSEKKADFVRDLGADHVINYKQERVSRVIREKTNKRGVDTVIDSVGGEMWMEILKSTRKGGTIVTCGATAGWNPDAGLNYIFYNQLEVKGSTMCSRTEAREVMNLVFEGELEPAIDDILPLKDAKKAHRSLERGDRLGKIVLKL